MVGAPSPPELYLTGNCHFTRLAYHWISSMGLLCHQMEAVAWKPENWALVALGHLVCPYHLEEASSSLEPKGLLCLQTRLPRQMVLKPSWVGWPDV